MAELEQDPIIVFGAPRSGTTYLEQILNAHPEVFISHESRLFAWLHDALANTRNDRLVASHREAFSGHLRSVFPEVIRAFYRSLAPDCRYWGDKNPHYADPANRGTLETIAELFPGSRFIHIIRDGRDVVSSLTRKRWDEEHMWARFDQAHRIWKQHVRVGRAFGESLPTNQYFELRYEDVIADDVASAADLFRFLGIDLHPAVERFCLSQQQKRTPFMEPARDLERGITASDWEQIFSPAQRLRSLELIGAPLVRYGYETEDSLEQLRRQATDILDSEDGEESVPPRKRGGHGYQNRDWAVVDYEMFTLPGTRRYLRGPGPNALAVGEYFTCVGAAQTFGCLCEKPYPALVAEAVHVPALNLGFAGAGPRFFLRDWGLLNYINQGRFTVLQVMSGRSEDNSAFETKGIAELTRRSDGKRMSAEAAYRELLTTDPAQAKTVVEETRANWVKSYFGLLGAIEVPTILLWFSQRSPDYQESYADVHAMFGEFPHLVNRAMIEEIKDLSDEYIECVSSRGIPQRLVSRLTGEPVSVDFGAGAQAFSAYYPSPEMHEDAAAALVRVCQRYAVLPKERV